MKKTYSSQDLARACIKLGWNFDRQSGSHLVYVKGGEPRPIVIPEGRKALARSIVSTIVRQLGIKKEDLPSYVRS